ncbi:MAG: hypothetical protein EXQ94_13265 [Alphaproteobacteria bacterium]|nr:hypothetical protein [Alphaproteobacteria bacterium]
MMRLFDRTDRLVALALAIGAAALAAIELASRSRNSDLLIATAIAGVVFFVIFKAARFAFRSLLLPGENARTGIAILLGTPWIESDTPSGAAKKVSPRSTEGSSSLP